MTGRLMCAAATGALLIAGAGPSDAATGFVEPDVHVLQAFHDAPTTYFGWAVSELGDPSRDGGAKAIIGDPVGTGASSGAATVWDPRSGKQKYLFTGAPGDQLGYAVADALDVDGDKVHDIVVGAPGNGPGYADVYSGRTGRLLLHLTGQLPGETFGAAVASAGDVNRDGRADLLVGAPGGLHGTDRTGRAYVFSGRTGALLRVLATGTVGDRFGAATDWTADVNGDHVPDQIVGAPDAGGGRAGAAYVFSGRNGRLLRTIAAGPSGGDLGWFFVAGVGDVNGDGVPDIYAGDFDDVAGGLDGSGNPAGRAAVYSGADGHELWSFTGAAGDGAGPGREAGDVNHDGVTDIAVGVYTSSAGGPFAGGVVLLSGRDGHRLRTITSSTAGEDFGFDAVGIGDVNNDGQPDLLASAASGASVYVIAGACKGSVSPGLGTGSAVRAGHASGAQPRLRAIGAPKG